MGRSLRGKTFGSACTAFHVIATKAEECALWYPHGIMLSRQRRWQQHCKLVSSLNTALVIPSGPIRKLEETNVLPKLKPKPNAYINLEMRVRWTVLGMRWGTGSKSCRSALRHEIGVLILWIGCVRSRRMLYYTYAPSLAPAGPRVLFPSLPSQWIRLSATGCTRSRAWDIQYMYRSVLFHASLLSFTAHSLSRSSSPVCISHTNPLLHAFMLPRNSPQEETELRLRLHFQSHHDLHTQSSPHTVSHSNPSISTPLTTTPKHKREPNPTTVLRLSDQHNTAATIPTQPP